MRYPILIILIVPSLTIFGQNGISKILKTIDGVDFEVSYFNKVFKYGDVVEIDYTIHNKSEKPVAFPAFAESKIRMEMLDSTLSIEHGCVFQYRPEYGLPFLVKLNKQGTYKCHFSIKLVAPSVARQHKVVGYDIPVNWELDEIRVITIYSSISDQVQYLANDLCDYDDETKVPCFKSLDDGWGFETTLKCFELGTMHIRIKE